MSDKEVRSKIFFVKNELKALLMKVNENITDTEYIIDLNYEEWVVITYDNGYRKKVNVSCDSLRAIAIDVLRVCG